MNSQKKQKRRFTLQEEEAIKNFRKCGLTLQEIAVLVGRTTCSIKAKVQRMQIFGDLSEAENRKNPFKKKSSKVFLRAPNSAANCTEISECWENRLIELGIQIRRINGQETLCIIDRPISIKEIMNLSLRQR